MRQTLCLLLLLVFFVIRPGMANADVPPPLQGSYAGTMNLYDEGDNRVMPLEVNLTMTDQVEQVEIEPGVFETMKVIDGNFLVDKEGGPFAFSKVRYRLNTSELDLSYKRTKGVTVGQPASFRLVGTVEEDGSITGSVLSSFKGQIGTFKLNRTASHPLVSVPQYEGIWYGLVKLVPEGEYERFGISIASTGFAAVNPDQLEFDYTLGKTGHMDYSIIQSALTHVVIDYLHYRISMANDAEASGLAVQARLDPKTHHLVGSFASRYGGLRGEFDLPKLEPKK